MNGSNLVRAALTAAKRAAKIRYPAVDESKITRALIICEDGRMMVRCQYRGADGKWDTIQVTEEHLDQMSIL